MNYTYGRNRQEFVVNNTAEINSLPTVGVENGSVALVINTGDIYFFNGTKWQVFAKEGDTPGETGLQLQVIDVLPETGVENIVYLVPKTEASAESAYDKWIWINDQWENWSAASATGDYLNRINPVYHGNLMSDTVTLENYTPTAESSISATGTNISLKNINNSSKNSVINGVSIEIEGNNKPVNQSYIIGSSHRLNLNDVTGLYVSGGGNNITLGEYSNAPKIEGLSNHVNIEGALRVSAIKGSNNEINAHSIQSSVIDTSYFAVGHLDSGEYNYPGFSYSYITGYQHKIHSAKADDDTKYFNYLNMSGDNHEIGNTVSTTETVYIAGHQNKINCEDNSKNVTFGQGSVVMGGGNTIQIGGTSYSDVIGGHNNTIRTHSSLNSSDIYGNIFSGLENEILLAGTNNGNIITGNKNKIHLQSSEGHGNIFAGYNINMSAPARDSAGDGYIGNIVIGNSITIGRGLTNLQGCAIFGKNSTLEAREQGLEGILISGTSQRLCGKIVDSVVEGSLNYVGGEETDPIEYCHIEGYNNYTNTNIYCSHVEGYNNNLTNGNLISQSHIEGSNHLVAGGNFTYLHAEGNANKIYSGSSNCHVEGMQNIVNNSQTGAHIGGFSNIITNVSAGGFVSGKENSVTNLESGLVFGEHNTIYYAPSGSLIGGRFNTVNDSSTEEADAGRTRTVFGEYNVDNKACALIIGNGTETSRSNALELDYNGDLTIAGDYKFKDDDGTVKNLLDIIKNLQDRIAALEG